MFNTFQDDYGFYKLEAEQEFDNRTIQWRKYNNSPRIKRLGGMYCTYCPETNEYKFYRNDYIRGKGLNKFIKKVQEMKCEWDEVIEDENS